jgi:hypothetical protein
VRACRLLRLWADRRHEEGRLGDLVFADAENAARRIVV